MLSELQFLQYDMMNYREIVMSRVGFEHLFRLSADHWQFYWATTVMYEGHYIFKACVHVNVCGNKCWLGVLLASPAAWWRGHKRRRTSGKEIKTEEADFILMESGWSWMRMQGRSKSSQSSTQISKLGGKENTGIRHSESGRFEEEKMQTCSRGGQTTSTL